MQYAWALTPAKFTAPDGKTILVDKSKPKDVIVSLDIAREIIKVARLSAYAQLCDLAEEQRANYPDADAPGRGEAAGPTSSCCTSASCTSSRS